MARAQAPRPAIEDLTSQLPASDPRVLADLRRTLAAAGYSEAVTGESVRRHRFLAGTGAAVVTELDERLTALVEMFALGEPVRLATARAALGPVEPEQIQDTGLLSLDREWAIPNYRLLPHGELLIAGDSPRPADPNVVIPFTPSSQTLALLTPRTPARSMLDLGTGSGILALLGAAHCDEVTGVDINPRAIALARFNAHLNQVPNLKLLQGSWFEPVAPRHFDLVVANAPYVVSPDRELAYRDSGLPGTELLERLTREAALHLEEGGLAILLCGWPHPAADDWADAPSAAAAETGCDALIIALGTYDPLDHAARWNTPPVAFLPLDTLRQNVARWLEHYRRTGTGAITYAAVILRRRSRGTPWVSALRAAKGPGELASEHVTRLLAGRDLLEALSDQALMQQRFSLPAGTEISQGFHRQDGRFGARPAVVELERGLGVTANVAPAGLDVLFACNGERTLAEAVERVAERQREDPGRVRETAVPATRELLAHGLLEAAR